MALCAGYMGRLGAAGFRASRPLGSSQLRSLSTISLQRPRLLLQYGEPRHAHSGGPRSFWSWSKNTANATPAVAESTAPIPTSTSEVAPAPEPSVPTEASVTLDAASASSTPDAALSGIPTEVLPVDFTSAIPSMLNYGDLAALGLASWTPAGLCRWTMELINVSTGMPWLWTIVTATVLSRVILLPFSVKQMQGTAGLAPYQKDIMSIRDEMATAQKNKDMLAMQRAALRQKMIYEKAGVSFGGMAIAPFVQMPVTLGMFFGVKKLCDYPVEQLKWGGLEWLPDLTVADPTMVLPVAAVVLMNVQISMSMRDLVGGSPQAGHIMNFLRILSTASVFFMWNLPSGVLVYLLTSISAMVVQSLVLRQAAIRRLFRIPVIPNDLTISSPSMRESFQYAKDWWGKKVADARVTNRR